MKYLVITALIVLSNHLIAQDSIMKISDKIMGVELIDRSQENTIQRSDKKLCSKPVYMLSKNHIPIIEYQNGLKQQFKSNTPLEYISTMKQTQTAKKSFFIGGRFALGNAAAQNDIFGYFDLNMATNLGADVGYFFNNIIGLKTGISYLNLPYGRQYESSISMLGIPTSLVLSIGEKAGFYTELGTVFYFPSGTSSSSTIISAENLIGFHFGSGIVDFKLGFLLNFTIKGRSSAFNDGSIFMGLNAGLSVYL